MREERILGQGGTTKMEQSTARANVEILLMSSYHKWHIRRIIPFSEGPVVYLIHIFFFVDLEVLVRERLDPASNIAESEHSQTPSHMPHLPYTDP